MSQNLRNCLISDWNWKGINDVRIRKQKTNIIKETNGTLPELACILVGEDKASQIYVASKEKACAECGLLSRIIKLPENCTESKLIDTITFLNSDERVSGILVQLPLPKHLNSAKIISHISPEKDVDCLSTQNLGALFSGTGIIAPCTASGIIKILDAQNIDICGKHAVVVGRSLLVGKSVATMLEQRNATVTICHSKTRNLEQITRLADILIVAIGKPQFISSTHIKPGAVVIDVGINRTENGIVGDVDFESVAPLASFITPVPGGVGPLTVACLLDNTLLLHENYRNKRG